MSNDLVSLSPTLVLALVAGLVGSPHCAGMCGGFALALGAASPSEVVRRQLLYSLGRVLTYAMLGMLAAGLGKASVGWFGLGVARPLAVVVGLVMVVAAVDMLGGLPPQLTRASLRVRGATAPVLRGVLALPGMAPPLAFGVVNALLPCPLLWAFVARAAVADGPGEGALLLLAFGLGTLPAMLGVGLAGRPLGLALRRRVARWSPAFVLALGLLTLARGVLPDSVVHANHVGHVATSTDAVGTHRGHASHPK